MFRKSSAIKIRNKYEIHKQKRDDIMIRFFLKQYAEGIDSKFNILKKKFSDVSSSQLMSLASKIDSGVLKVDIQKIKKENIDYYLDIAQKTKSNSEAKNKGLDGLIKGKDFLEFATGKQNVKAYIPLNHKASKSIASKKVCSVEGKWCVAANDPKEWNNFKRDATIIMFIIDSTAKNPKKSKLALNFSIIKHDKKELLHYVLWDSENKNIFSKMYMGRKGEKLIQPAGLPFELDFEKLISNYKSIFKNQ